MTVPIRAPAAETAYVTEVVARLRAVLGEALTAVYPTGSLALDGYLPGRSDIDLMPWSSRPRPSRCCGYVLDRLEE